MKRYAHYFLDNLIIWLHNVRSPRGERGGGEGWGTFYDGLYGKALPERGTFFRLQVYNRVGSVKGPKRANR